jgi:hypothetical protein
MKTGGERQSKRGSNMKTEREDTEEAHRALSVTMPFSPAELVNIPSN